MGITLEELNIIIDAKLEPLAKEMAKANRIVKDSTKKMEGHFSSLVKQGLAMGAAFVGIRKIISGFLGQLSEIDKIAKTSDRLGIATEELIALSHAVQITTGNSRLLNTALQRMTRRTAEAAQGTGVALKVLREMGLDAQKLKKQSPAKTFEDIAEAIQDVSSEADRVRIAMALFDTEGVALVNTLALGSKGLREMREEAEGLGLVMSREDAAAVEEVNDAITKLTGSLSGAAREILVAVAPALKAMADAITVVIKGFNAVIDFISDMWNFGRAVDSAADATADFAKEAKVAKEEVDEWQVATEFFSKRGVNALKEYERVAKETAERLDVLALGAFGEVEGAREALKELRRFGAVAEAQLKGAGAIGLGALSDEFDRLTGGAETLIRLLESGIGDADYARKLQQDLIEARKLLSPEALKSELDGQLDVLSEFASIRNELLSPREAIEEEIMLRTDALSRFQELFEEESEAWRFAEELKTRVANQGAEARKQLRDQEQQDVLANTRNVLSNLNTMFSAMSGESEKYFEWQKAIAIAQATINTAEGVSKAWAQGGVFGAIGAATVLAAGAAQIAAIKATKPGSSSTPTSGGGATDMSGGAVAPAEQRYLNLTIRGEGPMTDMLAASLGPQLAESLSGALGDGYEVRPTT